MNSSGHSTHHDLYHVVYFKAYMHKLKQSCTFYVKAPQQDRLFAYTCLAPI